MEDRNLPNALCDSITEEAGNAVADILEVGLILYLRMVC